MTQPSSARALWIERPGLASLRTQPLRAPGPGEVLVRALASGVSRGTESLVFHGQVPESEYARMRAPFQEGDFPGPVKYGYCSVGRVEAAPPERADLAGQRVFCLHPHQDYYVVGAEQVTPVPDAVPDGRAVLAANMETAVNAMWDAGVRVGDRVAVVGGGVVGLLCAHLAARIPGVRLEVVDIDPRRSAVAAALGLTLVTPEQATGDADLVLHCSGSAAGARTALGLAGFEATVLELSWFGTREVPLPLGGRFHSGRLTLRASQVGSIAESRRARRTYRDRMALALELLADERLDALLTHGAAFDDLPARMPDITDPDAGVLCFVVSY
jgi:threonine dehydrogenase-like Zn-dependent dehydrogenase